MLLGPVPEAWKPENQDPEVAYTVDEMTGIRTPLVVDEAPKKAVEPEPEPEAIESEDLTEPEPEPEAIEPEDLTEPEDPEAEKE